MSVKSNRSSPLDEKERFAIGFEKQPNGYWSAVLYGIMAGRAYKKEISEPALKSIAFDDFRSWSISKVFARSGS
jgi:hypothetical protein